MTTSAAHPLTITFNGSDNVGKTAQLAWVAGGIPGAHHVGSVNRWDDRWALVGGSGFSQWWFEVSTTEEHTQLMVSSHVARRAGSGPLALEDRGLPMILATCAATAMIKDGLGPEDALAKVSGIAARLAQPAPRHEIHVLLRRHDDPALEAEASAAREVDPVGERYRAYQHALALVVALQAERGAYDIELRLGDLPILDVQRLIRQRLADGGVSVRPLPNPPIDQVWILGGMSESGKSTVGEILRDEHGVTRLKIGYMLQLAAMRAGGADPYEWSAAEQAGRLTEEILLFATANKATTISLESAHQLEQTRHLRTTWGPRCHVVYVDVPGEQRVERALESRAELRQRDVIKASRGAEEIRGIADHVIDNSGSLAALKLKVAALVTRTSATQVIPPPWQPVSNAEWLRSAAADLTDPLTALVMATGSTGKHHWIDGWSDVDLLVVRDELPTAWLRAATDRVARPGYKVGLSAYTTADLAALRIPPRLISALRKAQDGTGVLYRRDDVALPVASEPVADAVSRGELGLVLLHSRRLLAAPTLDVRALYKHLVHLARILLGPDGLASEPSEVIEILLRTEPGLSCSPPSLDDVVHHADDPTVQQRLIDTVDAVLTHLDTIGRAPR